LKQSTHQEQKLLIKSKGIERKAAKHHSTFAYSSSKRLQNISKQKSRNPLLRIFPLHAIIPFVNQIIAQQRNPLSSIKDQSEKPSIYQSTQHCQLDQAQQPQQATH
jgi:hypothetical protein